LLKVVVVVMVVVVFHKLNILKWTHVYKVYTCSNDFDHCK
jgi:hypothetical protein